MLQAFHSAHYDEAANLASNILLIDKRSIIAWTVLGATKRVSGDLDNAIKYTKNAIDLDNKNYYAYNNLCVMQKEAGFFTESLTKYLPSIFPLMQVIFH